MCKVIPTQDPRTGRRLSFDKMADGLLHSESYEAAEREVARYHLSKPVIIPHCHLLIGTQETKDLLKSLHAHLNQDWEEVMNPPFWFMREGGVEVTTDMLEEELKAILDPDFEGVGNRTLFVGEIFGWRVSRAVVLTQLEWCFNDEKEETEAKLNSSEAIINNFKKIWKVFNRRERWKAYSNKHPSVKGQQPVIEVEDCLSERGVLWVDAYRGAPLGGDSTKHLVLTPKTKEAFGIKSSDLTYGEEMERLTPDSQITACVATEYKSSFIDVPEFHIGEEGFERLDLGGRLFTAFYQVAPHVPGEYRVHIPGPAKAATLDAGCKFKSNTRLYQLPDCDDPAATGSGIFKCGWKLSSPAQVADLLANELVPGAYAFDILRRLATGSLKWIGTDVQQLFEQQPKIPNYLSTVLPQASAEATLRALTNALGPLTMKRVAKEILAVLEGLELKIGRLTFKLPASYLKLHAPLTINLPVGNLSYESNFYGNLAVYRGILDLRKYPVSFTRNDAATHGLEVLLPTGIFRILVAATNRRGKDGTVKIQRLIDYCVERLPPGTDEGEVYAPLLDSYDLYIIVPFLLEDGKPVVTTAFAGPQNFIERRLYGDQGGAGRISVVFERSENPGGGRLRNAVNEAAHHFMKVNWADGAVIEKVLHHQHPASFNPDNLQKEHKYECLVCGCNNECPSNLKVHICEGCRSSGNDFKVQEEEEKGFQRWCPGRDKSSSGHHKPVGDFIGTYGGRTTKLCKQCRDHAKELRFDLINRRKAAAAAAAAEEAEQNNKKQKK